jgi:hypothetical protein
VRNNERYLAFTAAVPRAFLEMPDLRGQLFFYIFSMTYIRDAAMITAVLNLVTRESCAHHASNVLYDSMYTSAVYIICTRVLFT